VPRVALGEGGRDAGAGDLLDSAFDATSSMSTKATLAPCSAKCSTIDAPMPEPPPDTNTARSFRLG
jgi:hypothetical protein